MKKKLIQFQINTIYLSSFQCEIKWLEQFSKLLSHLRLPFFADGTRPPVNPIRNVQDLGAGQNFSAKLNRKSAPDSVEELDVVRQLGVEVGRPGLNHLGQCGVIWHAETKQISLKY